MKSKCCLVIIPLFFLVCGKTNAQTWLWAKALGGSGLDYGLSTAVDASGNVYTVGDFRGTADFNPGGGIFNLTANGVQADIFISKLDASGNFLWAKRIGGPDGDFANSVAVDTSGHVYITGSFADTVDFDPGPGTFYLIGNSNISPDIFVSKLDSSGNFIWAKAMGGIYNDEGLSIAVDANGNVYTTGYFRGTCDFDPGVDTFNISASPAGDDDIFVSKLDSSGNFVWAKAMGGITNDVPNSLALDAYGNVYTTGFFSGTADFDPGTGVFNLTSSGWDDIFISKLDSSGNFKWAKQMGGTDFDFGYYVAVDTSGNVYTGGTFSGTADFDPGIGTFYLTANGTDIFISKLDSSGNFVWAKRMGGTFIDNGYAIAVDVSGNVYSTGYFMGTADFDPDDSLTFYLTSLGNEDIFLSKLNTDGEFEWAKAVGGANTEWGYSIALDTSGNVYVTGRFSSNSMSFGSHTIITAGGYDVFVAKLNGTLIIGNNESENHDKDIFLFPNPSASHLTIALRSRNKKVEVNIADITGKIIYTTTTTETQKIEVNTKDFAEGVYLIGIKSENFTETKKLIIAR